jgi:hypothetical protein
MTFKQELEKERNEVAKIKEILQDLDPKYVMYAIRQLGKVYVPQCYYDEHAQEKGFANAQDMRESLEDFDLYYQVDCLVDEAICEIED